MRQYSLIKELTLCLLFFALCGSAHSQSCASPDSFCPGESSQTFSGNDGAPTSLPPGLCFNEAPNAIFFSFNTIDTDQFSFIDYTDSTATLTLSVDSCITDTLLGISVFSAADLCDPDSYSATSLCEIDSLGGGQYSLNGLLPATTYYVLVTGLTLPDGVTSNCTFSISAEGPALEYDLEPDAQPANEPQRSVLYEGEQLNLVANPAFGDLTWSGPALNSSSGAEVTADPEGVDITVSYTVSTTIDGCLFTDIVQIAIRPAILPYNAFSPNNDGFNDFWEIDNIEDWPNAQVLVYSRWGTLVFQETNYQNNWDGDDLPSATYYFVIELNPLEFNAEPITGSVTIMR